jgi:protein-S-isoprenylcysteine O-methyltransferase Ste14
VGQLNPVPVEYNFLNEEESEMRYDTKESESIVESRVTSSPAAAVSSTSGAPTAGPTARLLAFGYGLIAYTLFLGVYLYAIGFIGDFAVPTRLDSSAQGPIGWALLINLLLLGLFAVQHSVMARPGFKAVWTRVVPKPVERSTYVLFSSVALILLFALWQPMGVVVWNVENPVARVVLYGILATGFFIVLIATFLINHFDLFGMRQVWLYLRGREYTPLRFKTPLFYKYVRHPLYVGWLLAFWAAPTMTVAHLVFAVMTTAYILVAIQFEERDLITVHGEHYVRYRREVPMLIPRVPSPEGPGPGKIATGSECA